MLSYQHSFHAGNHADVIKHITLIALLNKLLQKPKPFFYLDTHAGSGAYDTQPHINKDPVLASEISNWVKTNTKTSLNNSISELILDYQHIIKPYLDKQLYPGSPLVAFENIVKTQADEHLQSQNNLHLSELHPSAFDGLKTWTKSSDFQLHKRNGFELLNALMPPKPNRGLVLIDPPYEQESEYNQVVDSVARALKKWPQGIFAIWFPLLSPTRLDRKTQEVSQTPKSGLSEIMLSQLANVATNGMLEVRFVKQAASEKVGMYGSGMAIINPPWQLDELMQEVIENLSANFTAANSNKEDNITSTSFVKYWVKPE